VARSCLQGRFLSPLLCILFVDELIEEHSENSCYTLGDADDTWADHLIPGLIFFPGNYNT